MTYHSLFSSHLQNGSQLWGHTNLANQNKIQKLQNRALRKILFKKQQDSIRQHYKELQILKLHDVLYLQNCLFMSQIETTQKLANSFADLKHCGDSHNYQTKSETKRLLDIPLLNTQIYGTQSVKYNCIKDWNNFRNNFSNLLPHQFTYTLVKKQVKNFLISKYWHLKYLHFVAINSRSQPCLSNHEILHGGFNAFLFKWSWLNLRFPLRVVFWHAVQDFIK